MQTLNDNGKRSHDERQGYPLVSVLPGSTLSPETSKVIYVSKNQMWLKVIPTEEERAMLGTLAIQRHKGAKDTEIASVYKVIGANLRRRRKAKGLSYTTLASMLGLKDDSSVSSMERGQQTIAVHRLIALADIFECSINDFLVDTGNEGDQ